MYRSSDNNLSFPNFRVMMEPLEGLLPAILRVVDEYEAIQLAGGVSGTPKENGQQVT